MFTDLAVIDWIALAFAAVLLAAASAAAVIAYATSANRHGPTPSLLKGLTRTHPPERVPHVVDLAETKPPAHAMTNDEQDQVSPVPEQVDPDRRLAERAARLRGRPVPEDRPGVVSQAVNHKALVQSVISNRTPAHAQTFVPSGLESGADSSNFDRAEGFKARTPGFFDDPMGRHELRYWDGHTWTEYVKERGERFTDPL